MPTPDSPSSSPARRGVVGEAVGDYVIEGELGRGGMGVVYRARQAGLDRTVALKMLTGRYGAEELARFLAEAQTAARLQHPHIVHIYEVGEHEGAPFFSMECVEAGTLADLIRRGTCEPRAAAELLRDVALAVHHAHQQGIIHRDLKPVNVLLTGDGAPKVADFGIAKRLTEDSGLTQTGAVVGTPAYMAPEQARGSSREVGPAADVYSLGAILYELLAGRPPFVPEESDTALTLRILTEEPAPPTRHRSDIPRELEIICLKCLEKEPPRRYGSAAAFAEDLRRYLDDEPILAKPPTHFTRAWKWTRKRPWLTTFSLALLIAASIAGQKLWHWEMQERLRVEYASELEFRDGGMESLDRLTLEQCQRRASSLRLTRRGRRGPIVKVEALNPRGYPTVAREIGQTELIFTYMEGLVNAQPLSERLAETTTVEILHSLGLVRELTGRDRTGLITWRLLYDRPSEWEPNVTRARFVNVRGFDAASRTGASQLEIKRDENGRDREVRFFNAFGVPALNGEGVHGYRMERDAKGRLVGLMNMGRDDRAIANRSGLTACRIEWNADGLISGMEILDAAGQPALWGIAAAIRTDYDPAGNAVRQTRLGRDGKLAQGAAGEWNELTYRRNERGEVLEYRITQTLGDAPPQLLLHKTFTYDHYGHPVDHRLHGEHPWWTWEQHDAAGNITEARFLNEAGQPDSGDRGYAIKRMNFTTGPHGLRRVTAYFDAAEKKAYGAAGSHLLIDEFDLTGVLRRQTNEDFDPARYRYYRLVSLPSYDTQGRPRSNTLRFEKADGQLATDAGLAFTESEDNLDEEGRSVITWHHGGSDADGRATSIRTDTDWQYVRVMKRRIRQVCNSAREPLPYLASGEPAREEEEWDGIGQLTRLNESGFDEKRVGFARREATFTNGTKLQSALHWRGDGSAVKTVQAVVQRVLPQAQTAAQALRAGDVLVALNGNPLGCLWEWTLGENFPGGSIEILRDGQRMTLEGFTAGQLGVWLEDRAVAE